jgi:hypothetical protein
MELVLRKTEVSGVSYGLEKFQLELSYFSKNRIQLHWTPSSNSIISLNSSSFFEFFIWLERGEWVEENGVGIMTNQDLFRKWWARENCSSKLIFYGLTGGFSCFPAIAGVSGSGGPHRKICLVETSRLTLSISISEIFEFLAISRAAVD